LLPSHSILRRQPAGPRLDRLFATNSSNVNIAGKNIPDEVFAQIQPGKTKDFVVDLLGNPAMKTTEDNGREVWRWNYDETKTAAKTFMIFYVALDRTHTTQTDAVAFKDGVVVKTWRE